MYFDLIHWKMVTNIQISREIPLWIFVLAQSTVFHVDEFFLCKISVLSLILCVPHEIMIRQSNQVQLRTSPRHNDIYINHLYRACVYIFIFQGLSNIHSNKSLRTQFYWKIQIPNWTHYCQKAPNITCLNFVQPGPRQHSQFLRYLWKSRWKTKC